jgi:hypothetical protein
MSAIEEALATLPAKPKRHQTRRARLTAYATLGAVIALGLYALWAAPRLESSSANAAEVRRGVEIDACVRYYSARLNEAQGVVEDASARIDAATADVEDAQADQAALLLLGLVGIERGSSIVELTQQVPLVLEAQSVARAERADARADRDVARDVRDVRRDELVAANRAAFTDADAFIEDEG